MMRTVLPNAEQWTEDTTVAPVAITLSAVFGKNYFVKNAGTGGNPLTVNYGASSVELDDGAMYFFSFDGTTWATLSGGGGGGAVIQGVAGVAITGPTFLFIGADGKLYKGDKRDLGKSILVGCAITTGLLDEPIKFTQGGPVSGFTGLEKGREYFLGNAGEPVPKGTIADGEQTVPVGVAMSATEMLVKIGLPKMAPATLNDGYIGEIRRSAYVNNALLAKGWKQFATGDGISQANFPVAFAAIGHKYNALHVAVGDPDLSDNVAGLFYPTPPPTEDGWVKIYENPTNITNTLAFSVPNGLYRLKVGRINVDFFTLIVNITDQTNQAIGSWSSDRAVLYQAGNWNTGLAGYGIQLIERFEPETRSTDGAYGYVKVEDVTPSGEAVSALREVVTIPLPLAASDTVITHKLQAPVTDLKTEVWWIDTGGSKWQLSGGVINASGNNFGVQISDIGYKGSITQFVFRMGANRTVRLNASGNWETISVGSIELVITRPNLISTSFDVSELPREFDLTAASELVTLPPHTGAPIKRVYTWTNGGTHKIQFQDSDLVLSEYEGEGAGIIEFVSTGTAWKVVKYEDTGSNANGEWEKSLNGKLICTGISDLVTNTVANNFFGGSAGATYFTFVSKTFPHSFVEIPRLRPWLNRMTSNSGLGVCYSANISATQGDLYGFSTGNGQTMNIAWEAVGKWKA